MVIIMVILEEMFNLIMILIGYQMLTTIVGINMMKHVLKQKVYIQER